MYASAKTDTSTIIIPIAITIGSQIGARTHIHDHVITLQSFKTINATKSKEHVPPGTAIDILSIVAMIFNKKSRI